MSLFSHGGHLLVAAIKVIFYKMEINRQKMLQYTPALKMHRIKRNYCTRNSFSPKFSSMAGHHPCVQHSNLLDPARPEGAPGPGDLRLLVPGRPQARLLRRERVSLRVECSHRYLFITVITSFIEYTLTLFLKLTSM